MTAAGATLVWFRHDLRLADQPALRGAIERGGPIVPVYVHAPEDEGHWAPGGASRWWLLKSLRSLSEALEQRSSRLIVQHGPTVEALAHLVEQTGATAVYWCRRYEPEGRRIGEQVKQFCAAHGLEAQSFNGSLLAEPWEVLTKQRQPYQVFTPFWRALEGRGDPPEPLAAPRKLLAPDRWPRSVPLDELKLEPRPVDWAGGLREAWTPGEQGAATQLKRFVARALTDYETGRDLPATEGVSRLSPFLHFGEVSPRQVWHAIRSAAQKNSPAREASGAYLRQLGWRDFAHHLLFHAPQTVDRPLRESFEHFPWRDDAPALRAWERGRTGFPIVDAGMRQLWHTGWMHNRVRMIAASLLVKDLLIPWQYGSRWFWDTLVDADLANNTLGWQWVAGCGADAAPFFRIFNPTSQGRRFDPEGDYVRRWVPELARLPGEWIHAPTEAPPEALRAAGIELDRDYPRPIVDHAQARQRALAALKQTKTRR